MKRSNNWCPKREIITELENYRSSLEQILTQSKERLACAPMGKIHPSRKKNTSSFYYYQRISITEKTGRYLRKRSELGMIQALCQKKYDEKAIEWAEAEKSAVDEYLKMQHISGLEQIYTELPAEIRQYLKPIAYDQNTFSELWQAQKFTPKGFREDAPAYTTFRGEPVRSKSEVMIANELFRRQIPYRYECPLTCGDGVEIYPDFQLLDVRNRREFYWEHFGMMDNPEYVQNVVTKIKRYRQNGYYPGVNLILTFENAATPLTPTDIACTIEMYLGRK